MPLSPILERQTTYPFVRLNEARALVEAARRSSDRLRHRRPARADRPADPARHSSTGCASGWAIRLPSGLPELREAIAAWAARRFGVALDPDTEVIPTLGSKEAIFSFAQVVVDSSARKDTVVFTEPGYPGLRARRALRARTRAGAAAARGERLPPRSRRDRRARPGTAWRSSGSTTRTTPPARPRRSSFYERARGARARARVRPRLRRGVHASSGSTSRRRLRCRSAT